MQKTPGTNGFTGDFSQNFKKDIIPILYKFFKKIAKKTFHLHYKARISLYIN